MDKEKKLNEIKNLLKNKFYKAALSRMKNLYKENPNDIDVKYVLALTLSNFELTLNDSKKIFINLLDTKYKYDSLLELGKIELKENNLLIAKKCFNYLVYLFNDTNSIYELGIIELRENNLNKAKEYFNHLLLLNSKNKNNAILKLIYIAIIENNIEEVNNLLNKIDYNIEFEHEINSIKEFIKSNNKKEKNIYLNKIMNNSY